MDWIESYFYAPTSNFASTPPAAREAKHGPTHLDVEVIALLYRAIAPQQKCSECGHHLGRGLRLRTCGAAAQPRWPVKAKTRCWGWRRHVHIAAVTRPSKDLMFGDLKFAAHEPPRPSAQRNSLGAQST